MSETNQIEIRINAENPVEYLACCGIFEIASRIDRSAEAYWTKDTPTNFVLMTTCEEEDLTRSILQTLADKNSWRFLKHPKSGEVVRISVDFPNGEKPIRFDLDWWYNTLTRDGGVNEGKTFWKMYTAKVTTESAYKDLIKGCQKIGESSNPISLSELLKTSAVMEKGEKGRFGFDPRSSRGELDVGYSIDEQGEATVTFVYAELLSMIGVSGFFPSRTSPNKFQASRSWKENCFQYYLWHSQAPIALARVHAATSALNEESNVSMFQAKRVKRGLGFYNFLLSTPKT